MRTSKYLISNEKPFPTFNRLCLSKCSFITLSIKIRNEKILTKDYTTIRIECCPTSPNPITIPGSVCTLTHSYCNKIINERSHMMWTQWPYLYLIYIFRCVSFISDLIQATNSTKLEKRYRNRIEKELYYIGKKEVQINLIECLNCYQQFVDGRPALVCDSAFVNMYGSIYYYYISRYCIDADRGRCLHRCRAIVQSTGTSDSGRIRQNTRKVNNRTINTADPIRCGIYLLFRVISNIEKLLCDYFVVVEICLLVIFLFNIWRVNVTEITSWACVCVCNGVHNHIETISINHFILLSFFFFTFFFFLKYLVGNEMLLL